LVKYVSHRGKYGADSLSSLTNLQNGRYAILKKLGEGGKGVVYKARDTVLNRVVAIKVLKTAVAGEESYSRFMREAQAVGKLNHPNIVTIHDVGKEDEKQFFILEFVDGMNLRELIGTYPEGKCDIQTALRIGVDVGRALEYAHSQGILHRDVKPENVMITRDDTTKLMDFGLAKMLGQQGLTEEGVIVGTVAFLAPEMALGRGADARSDLYSFGAVLYEAVTGKPPFVGEDSVKVIFSHIHDYPVSPSRLNAKVPQGLADCIMKLLEKDPDKRYQTASDLLQVLRDIAEGFLREAYGPSGKPAVVVPSSRPIAAKEIQLVDRADEMSLLREAVDRAVRGEGGLVFLYGEAGIGKTRLARELRAYAHLRGMRVLYGRCPALFKVDGVPPYVLWSEVVRDYLEDCSPEQLYHVVGFYPAEIAKVVPELRQKLGAIPQSFPISPEMEQNRLFEAFSQFIGNISKEAPLLVVLDDLQWTDSTSLLLLHYLARGAHRSSLLLLGAYRSTDIDPRHPLTAVLTELNRERLLQSVSLKRMSLNDISEMIKQTLEQDDVPAEFCRMVYEKTRGNPFFAEEVIRSLKEEEVIHREKNRWSIGEVSRIEFPETVKSVVKARIDRLGEECQNALTRASFIGNDFTCEVLAAVTGIEENKLLEVIEKLLKTGLVKHRVIRGEDVCSFADIIIRDVVYEEVSPFRRKKLHNTVGCALEQVYAKRIDEHFGELALHFLESGEKDKALDYFLKAGERAARIYANSEAASYLQSTLRLLEEKEGGLQEKGRILESLGDIKKLVGEYEDGMKYWNQALQLWTMLQEKEKTAILHRKMANVLWDKMGDAEKAKEHHEACLKILEAEPEGVENARLYYDMSYMQWRNGDLVKALASAEKALMLAEKLDALEVVADACLNLGALFFFSGDFKKSREYVNRALKTALDNGFLEIAVLAYYRVAGSLPQEEYERVFEYEEKGLSLAKKVGDIGRQAWFLNDLAYLYSLMGELDKAITLGEEALILNRKAGNVVYIAMCLSTLGFTYQLSGEWSKSEQYYDEEAAISRRLTEVGVEAECHFDHGLLLFGREEYAKARESFEEALLMVERVGRRTMQFWYSKFLIRTLIELGEIEKATALLDKLRGFALEIGEKSFIADEMALRAMLLRARKKYAESIELFEKTLQEWESIKARIWNAYNFARIVLCEYARVYLERNQEGDKEKAYNLLNQALEMFQKMGAKKDIEKILAKKKLLTS
jgi:tetratricopeptide (TPR) repeat protein/tRNA A-37 threonylcarbamoyl transferase component Bud32